VSLVVVQHLGQVPYDLVVVTTPDPNGQIIVPIEPLHVTGVGAYVLDIGEQHALGDARENQATDLGEIESLRKAVTILRDRKDIGVCVVIGQEIALVDGVDDSDAHVGR